jgi:hypothetical protein
VSEDTPRTIDSEVQGTIDLINLAYEALKKPVYLVYGHDDGVLASRVITFTISIIECFCKILFCIRNRYIKY